MTLVPAASIAGTVVLARGGAPVPFALVSLRAAGEGLRDVQADDRGHFDIANVAPGSYAIEARGQGARSQHPVDVAAFASAKASVTVPIDARARVHGHIVSPSRPVARKGIRLGFASTSEWGTSVRTGDDGSFTIDDAPIGNVLVTIDDHDVEAPRTLRVLEGGIADVTVHVAAKAQALVTVTRQGAPVTDATVFLRGPNGSDSKATNAAGIATFRGLAESTYRVFAEHDNDFAVIDRVEVSRDAPVKISLELTPGCQVAGRVVDEHGQPVDGARVSFALVSETVDGGASAISGPP